MSTNRKRTRLYWKKRKRGLSVSGVGISTDWRIVLCLCFLLSCLSLAGAWYFYYGIRSGSLLESPSRISGDMRVDEKMADIRLKASQIEKSSL